MQQAGIPRLFVVQRLYRRVLKLHRFLPTELKKLGDEYTRDEFRRNKSANQLQAYEFMTEWKNYADSMEEQFISEGKIGRNLNQNEVNLLSQEQLGQLYQLQQEATNPTAAENESESESTHKKP
ncbi:succinate dehydrogenase assembly factor 3, mitochondrial-like [Clytia hemisphaerica]|uniref:succinate dehydrogenase assembly factor 3, mitochondrial-like n=1 Tax=Clytia hemisphaerica TaxID=252671 RepID=UPI0034D589F1